MAEGRKFDVVEWMAEHGRPEYRIQIENLLAQRDEITAEVATAGGISWFGDHRVQLAMIDAEVDDIRAAAYERFTDWATD